MKLSKILMLAALPLGLAACSASTKSVSPTKPPQLAIPDSALLKVCGTPVDIGTGPLTQEQLEEFWITDRLRLLDCKRRQRALVNFITERDNALRAETSK